MLALRICRLRCSNILMPLRVACVVTVLPMCRNKQVDLDHTQYIVSIFNPYVIPMVKLHAAKQCFTVVYRRSCGGICKCDFYASSPRVRYSASMLLQSLSRIMIKTYGKLSS